TGRSLVNAARLMSGRGPSSTFTTFSTILDRTAIGIRRMGSTVCEILFFELSRVDCGRCLLMARKGDGVLILAVHLPFLCNPLGRQPHPVGHADVLLLFEDRRVVRTGDGRPVCRSDRPRAP